MNMTQKDDRYQKIKISKQAYLFLKEKSKQDKYRGRGLIGVVDELTLGRFTTDGSGIFLKKCGGKPNKKS